MQALIAILALGVLYFLTCIRVLSEYERGVVFRFGRVLTGPKGPGLIFVFWPIDRLQRVSLRLVTQDVPPQDVVTYDNVSVTVNAVTYFRVMDADKSVIEVENYRFATAQMAQTTLRSVIGQVQLDDLLSRRDEVNDKLQSILDRQTDPWGIKVSNVEVKQVDLPQNMQSAIARQARAERERRAKVISAEGEYQAARRLVDAATMMEPHPMALQMRFLQTLSDIATDKHSNTVLPVPLDLFRPFFPEESGKE